MTTPTGKEVREWCEEALQICAAIDSMLVSGVYRTETSRWWAICNEFSRLQFKIRVIHMKTRESRAWNYPLLVASRFACSAESSAYSAYSEEYHLPATDLFSQTVETCKSDCKRHLDDVKKHISGTILRCS